MGHLGDLIQGYQDRDGASQNFIASKVGVSSTVVGRWKKGDIVELPKRELLEALAEQIKVPVEEVVEAALNDTYFKDAGEVQLRRNPGRGPKGPDVQGAD